MLFENEWTKKEIISYISSVWCVYFSISVCVSMSEAKDRELVLGRFALLDGTCFSFFL